MQLTQAKLKEHLHYDPATGVFIWIKPKAARTKVGSVAGSLITRGYLVIMIDGISHLCHRLAWLYMYGYMPDSMVDHKDNDQLNNRIDNLRLVDKSKNACNAGIASNNTTGYKGVHINKGKYVGCVALHGITYYVGRYDTAEQASVAIMAKRSVLHGEYTNHGI